jgi:hypothetical protein
LAFCEDPFLNAQYLAFYDMEDNLKGGNQELEVIFWKRNLKGRDDDRMGKCESKSGL